MCLQTHTHTHKHKHIQKHKISMFCTKQYVCMYEYSIEICRHIGRAWARCISISTLLHYVFTRIFILLIKILLAAQQTYFSIYPSTDSELMSNDMVHASRGSLYVYARISMINKLTVKSVCLPVYVHTRILAHTHTYKEREREIACVCVCVCVCVCARKCTSFEIH